MLDGEKAQRADAARRLADLDKRAALGDASPTDHQQQRQQLVALQQRLSSQVGPCGIVGKREIIPLPAAALVLYHMLWDGRGSKQEGMKHLRRRRLHVWLVLLVLLP